MSDRYLRSDKQQLLNSLGSELCWGWSPALDLLSYYKGDIFEDTGKNLTATCAETQKNDRDILDFLEDLEPTPVSKQEGPRDESGGINILLCGAADIRHILHTLSSPSFSENTSPDTKSQKEINFYIYEPNLRVHSRHLLFLQWLFDSTFSLTDLEDRVAMFLEAFGNTRVREITAFHIQDLAKKILKAVEDEVGSLSSVLSFCHMKLSEKDFITEQLRSWCSEAKSNLTIGDDWSQRLRAEMAERFDNKDNIIDWDFNFSVAEHTHALKFQEYRHWRNTGIAYDYAHINPRKGVNYEYTKPNPSLCHFQRPVNGIRRGSFVGDIKVGPFFSFGTDTANPHLKKRGMDGALKFGNGVIAMHNIRAWLFRFMTAEQWPWTDHVLAWDDPTTFNTLPPRVDERVERQSKLPKVRFHFIGLDFNRFIINSQSKGISFDSIFLGCTCGQLLTKDLCSLMHSNGSLFCETIKFVSEASDEAKEAYIQRMTESGTKSGVRLSTKTIATIHHDIPPLKKREVEATEGQARADRRYNTPWCLAFEVAK